MKKAQSLNDYLHSAERRKSYMEHPEYPRCERLEERLAELSHADVANWKESQKKR